MNKTEEQKLKPCPFCGKFENKIEKEIYGPFLIPWEHGYMIRCGRCPAQMKVQTRFKSQARTTWNYRDGKLE